MIVAKALLVIILAVLFHQSRLIGNARVLLEEENA